MSNLSLEAYNKAANQYCKEWVNQSFDIHLEHRNYSAPIDEDTNLQDEWEHWESYFSISNGYFNAEVMGCEAAFENDLYDSQW